MSEASFFLGRTDEIRRFTEAVNQLTLPSQDDRNSWSQVILVHGLGGIGKSSLLRRLKEEAQALQEREGQERFEVAWTDFEREREERPTEYGGEAGPGLVTVLNSVYEACRGVEGKTGRKSQVEGAFDDFREAVLSLPIIRDQLETRVAELKQKEARADAIATAEKSAALVAALVLDTSSAAIASAGISAAFAGGRALLPSLEGLKNLFSGGKVPANKYDLVSGPEKCLATLCGEAIRQVAEYYPMVIFLDTAEIIQEQLGWLRTVMSVSGPHVLWVLGVRLEEDAQAESDSPIKDFVRHVPEQHLKDMPLRGFDDETIRSFLSRKLPHFDLSDEDVDRISTFTRGLPLSVSLVSQMLAEGASIDDACAEIDQDNDPLAPASPSKVVKELAKRFLSHASRAKKDHGSRDIDYLLLLALSNRDLTKHPDLMRALWGTDEDLNEILERLARRYDFVLSRSYRVHDHVRSVFRNFLCGPLEREQVAAACARVADLSVEKLEKMREDFPTLNDRLGNAAYLALLMDYVWYQWWTESSKGWKVTLSALPILAACGEEASLMERAEWFAVRGTTDEQKRFRSIVELSGDADGAEAPERIQEVAKEFLTERYDFETFASHEEREIALSLLVTRRLLESKPTLATLNKRLLLHEDQKTSVTAPLAQPLARELVRLGVACLSRESGANSAARALLLADHLSPLSAGSLAAVASRIGEKVSSSAVEHCEALYRKAIDRDSTQGWILGSYALFLANVRGEYERAQELFERAVEADPLDAITLGNYSLFLKNVRGEYERAQELYERAVEDDPHNAITLGNYAVFLADVRGEYERAQELFERAVEADPLDAITLGNYAVFLKNVRGEYERAQELFERAVEADPHNAITLGNYAQCCFISGNDGEGRETALRAISLASDGELPLVAECSFYLFAHVAEERMASGERLKQLLEAGVTTGDWSFDPNLQRIARENDPRYSVLSALAEALKQGNVKPLQEFPRWWEC